MHIRSLVLASLAATAFMAGPALAQPSETCFTRALNGDVIDPPMCFVAQTLNPGVGGPFIPPAPPVVVEPPVVPVEPVDPVDPPVDPVDPVDPPVDPVDPVDPEVPAVPLEPAEPTPGTIVVNVPEGTPLDGFPGVVRIDTGANGPVIYTVNVVLSPQEAAAVGLQPGRYTGQIVNGVATLRRGNGN